MSESYLESLNRALDQTNRVIDAFLIVGFSEEVLQAYKSSSSPLTPSVLSSLPHDYAFPPSLPNFCFPSGVHTKPPSKRTQSEVFSFTLIDPGLDYLYCSCLLVYEPLHHSSSPLTSSFRRKDKSAVDLSIRGLQSAVYSVVTRRKSHRINSQELKKDKNQLTISFWESEFELVPKCLVFISKVPFLKTLEKLLVHLYRLTMKKLKLPIECYVTHLILQLPMPPSGKLEVLYTVDNEPISVSMPPANQFPLLDTNFGCLFHALDIGKIIEVFHSLCLEQSIILISSDMAKLTHCSYTLTGLLFPFSWTLLHLPVLPQPLDRHLNSPVNYIYGVHSSHRSKIKKKGVCVVDLDKNKIKKKGKNLPMMPPLFTLKLTKRLKRTIGKISSSDIRLSTSSIDEFSVERLRKSFCEFFVCLFLEYRTYLNIGFADPEDFSTLFDKAGFLSEADPNDFEFLEMFLSTEMFGHFCESRIWPKSAHDHNRNMFFDDVIQAKKNKSKRYKRKRTSFLSDSSMAISRMHIVPLVENCFVSIQMYEYETFPNCQYNVLETYGVPIMNRPNFVGIDRKPETRAIESRDKVLSCWIDVWVRLLTKNDWWIRLGEIMAMFKKYRGFSIELQTKILDAVSFNFDLLIPLTVFLRKNNYCHGTNLVLNKVLFKSSFMKKDSFVEKSDHKEKAEELGYKKFSSLRLSEDGFLVAEQEKVCEFYSVETLSDKLSLFLSDKKNFDLNSVRQEFPDLIWNSVWHFRELGLPSEFLIPCESVYIENKDIESSSVSGSDFCPDETENEDQENLNENAHDFPVGKYKSGLVRRRDSSSEEYHEVYYETKRSLRVKYAQISDYEESDESGSFEFNIDLDPHEGEKTKSVFGNSSGNTFVHYSNEENNHQTSEDDQEEEKNEGETANFNQEDVNQDEKYTLKPFHKNYAKQKIPKRYSEKIPADIYYRAKTYEIHINDPTNREIGKNIVKHDTHQQIVKGKDSSQESSQEMSDEDASSEEMRDEEFRIEIQSERVGKEKQDENVSKEKQGEDLSEEKQDENVSKENSSEGNLREEKHDEQSSEDLFEQLSSEEKSDIKENDQDFDNEFSQDIDGQLIEDIPNDKLDEQEISKISHEEILSPKSDEEILSRESKEEILLHELKDEILSESSGEERINEFNQEILLEGFTKEEIAQSPAKEENILSSNEEQSDADMSDHQPEKRIINKQSSESPDENEESEAFSKQKIDGIHIKDDLKIENKDPNNHNMSNSNNKSVQTDLSGREFQQIMDYYLSISN